MLPGVAGCKQPPASTAAATPLGGEAVVADEATYNKTTAPNNTNAPIKPGVTLVAAQLELRNPLDEKRAFGYLSQLANIGPRPSGSRGMIRQQAILIKHFETLGAKVTRQKFTILHPLTGKRVRCANLLITWHPKKADRVLLCAHYDTRPLPDQDPNPRRRREGTFVGANDGASGVAVLMELAHHLPNAEMSLGVDMVLFDAEELVYGENLYGRQLGEYFHGSKFFANNYRKNRPAHRYHWGVLLDMVGDANLEILQEKHGLSWPDTRPLIASLWKTAHRIGVKEFVPRTKKGVDQGYVLDDHIALRNIARIPTCDIIDADYPDVGFAQPGSYWHTEQDLPKHCSGESLSKVGWVVFEWLKIAQPPQAVKAVQKLR